MLQVYMSDLLVAGGQTFGHLRVFETKGQAPPPNEFSPRGEEMLQSDSRVGILPVKMEQRRLFFRSCVTLSK